MDSGSPLRYGRNDEFSCQVTNGIVKERQVSFAGIVFFQNRLLSSKWPSGMLQHRDIGLEVKLKRYLNLALLHSAIGMMDQWNDGIMGSGILEWWV